jgi:hypothetical protein
MSDDDCPLMALLRGPETPEVTGSETGVVVVLPFRWELPTLCRCFGVVFGLHGALGALLETLVGRVWVLLGQMFFPFPTVVLVGCNGHAATYTTSSILWFPAVSD